MENLIGRWAAGDESAGEALYRGYFDRVRDYLASRGVKQADAEDVAQEALIAGLDGLREGAQPQQLTGWIIGIAKHISARQTRLLLKTIDAADPRERSARSMVIRKEMNELLGSTLKSLSDTDRRVLDMAHGAGLSRKAIAEKLGVDVEAIHARMLRAGEKLREVLSRHFTTVALRTMKGRGVSIADIQGLRPLFRQPVTLRHLEELSEEASARKLAVSAATLRARLKSAYEMLGSDEAPDFARAREEYRGASKR